MSISRDHFHQACHIFQRHWQNLEADDQWDHLQVLESFGTSYLRITKRLALPTSNVIDSHTTSNTGESQHADEITEDDNETLSKSPPVVSPQRDEKLHVIVNYDIIHSPSYQVPVLYLSFHENENNGFSFLTDPGNGTRNFQPSIEQLYDLLIPSSHHRNALEHVGVMGALSMADHPVSGSPVYFVHPCRTVEATRSVVDSRHDGHGHSESARPERYLLAWFGVVGAAVGLVVPVALARTVAESADL